MVTIVDGAKFLSKVVVDDENKTTLCSQARHHFWKSRVVCVECKLGEMLDAACVLFHFLIQLLIYKLETDLETRPRKRNNNHHHRHRRFARLS